MPEDYIGRFRDFADAEWIRHGKEIRLANPWHDQFGSYLFRVYDNNTCQPFARLESGAIIPLTQHAQGFGLRGKKLLQEELRHGRLQRR